MKYTTIFATLGGFLSAMVSGGTLFESYYHLSVFLMFVVPLTLLGSILDKVD